MSIRALLKGVEKRLRSEGVLDDAPGDAVGRACGIHDDGRPPNSAGQTFYAVWWGGGRGTDRNPQRHDVTHAVTVTLTARLNYAPRDRQGDRLAGVGDVYDLVDAIAAPGVIHGSWDVVNYANEFIAGTAAWAALDEDNRAVSVNGFVEPLVLGPFNRRPTPAGWLGADGAPKDVVVFDVRFELARRIQSNG